MRNSFKHVFYKKRPRSQTVQKGRDARRDEGYAAPRTAVRKQVARRATTQIDLFQQSDFYFLASL